MGQAQKGFINEEDNLKLNPYRKRKPMELSVMKVDI